jgi:hypothetical protein
MDDNTWTVLEMALWDALDRSQHDEPVVKVVHRIMKVLATRIETIVWRSST